MNWYSPRADEVDAPAVGLKSDSILAVASMYSKLTPVDEAACLIAPATRTRAGSTPAAAVAFEVSTDMFWVPRSPGNNLAQHAPFLPNDAAFAHHSAAVMVNGELR